MATQPAERPTPKCSSCQTEMKFYGTYRIDATREDLPALGEFLKSALFLHIYLCPSCGKFEFYQAQ